MATKTKKRGSRLLTILGVSLIVLGLATLGFIMFYPDKAEKAAGEVRIITSQTVMQVRGQDYPIVTLGERGSMAALDRCDGSFIEMGAYETEGLQPVYAAHNICKGEDILPLEVGDRVEIKGRGLYEIMTETHTKKTWSTTDEILGMEGDLILQSCYYGENRMKFISLAPVVDSENPQSPETETTS